MTNRFPLIVDSVSQTIKELPSGDNLDLTGSGAIFDDITVNGDLTVDTNVLFADAANNRVGIGTSSPATALDVVGTITADGLTVDGNASLVSGGATRTLTLGPSGAGIEYNIDGTTTFQGRTDAYPVEFDTNSTRRMRLDSNGDISFYEDTGTTPKFFWDASAEALGIGTSSPNEKLQVAGTIGSIAASGSNGLLVGDFGSDAGTFKIDAVSGRSLRFVDLFAGVERMRIDSSGNVGIGTSSPFNDTGYTAIDIRGSTGGQINFGTTSTRYGQISSNATNGLVFNTTAAVPMLFFTDGNERARIDASGNLLVGTTSNHSSPVRGWFAAPSGGIAGGFYNPSTGAANQVLFVNPNGAVGSIQTIGLSTSYNTFSDYRLKENVVPLAGAADRLAQIPVHRFNFIADPDTTVDGFIAHEVQEIVPEAITGTKDEVDDEGNPVYQGIDQSKLTPLLTAALQEALKRIEALEVEMQAMKDAGNV